MRSFTEHLGGARAVLDAHPADSPLYVVGATLGAARALVRAEAARRGALSGWRAITLSGLAGELAEPSLDRDGASAVSPLGIEAIVTELLARRSAETLGRYAASRHSAGLVRALGRTLGELAEADVAPSALAPFDPVLSALYAELRDELTKRRLVDAPAVKVRAIHALKDAALPPVILLEVPVESALEGALVAALGRASQHLFAVVPPWDVRTREALGEDAELVPAAVEPMQRIARSLFLPDVEPHPSHIERFSARTEGEECVELVSRILASVREGTKLEDMAVVLPDPALYRAPLAEALTRAGLGMRTALSARRPDPAGRALLALIDCALEHLSARAFAEYLSFGVSPAAVGAAPPLSWPANERLGEPDEDALDGAEEDDGGEGPVRAGTLRSPERFERLLVDAAVVGGGSARWERRLAGLRERIDRALEAADDGARRGALLAERADLDALEGFAIPLLKDLEGLNRRAPLAAHLDALAALATRALNRPRRVLAVLSSAARRGDQGELSLAEVRRLLDLPLRDALSAPEPGARGVEVLGLSEVRGRRFQRVFLPGLSERAFPRPVREDPILGDVVRTELGAGLMTRHERAVHARNELRAVTNAAEKQLVASHPRTDPARGRARLPSLYLLELGRASEARLPSIDDAAPTAPRGRLGAPLEPGRAIDETEHGLSTLGALLQLSAAEAKGRARYLFDVHPGLRRAVRLRYSQERTDREYSADGLVAADPASNALLRRHAIKERVYSATALESFAACPYRFYLKTILRLAPREELEPLLELDPLLRGSLVHSLQFRALSRLKTEGLAVSPSSLPRALEIVDVEFARLRAELLEQHVVAIPGAIEDDLRVMRADARRWIELVLASGWTPLAAELAFGMESGPAAEAERDATSQSAPLELASGIRLRGAIDLVEEKNGVLRATDYKTGRARVTQGGRIAGGTSLQPVLYAEALAALPVGKDPTGAPRTIQGGRLSYCTSRGGFSEVEVPYDEGARAALSVLTGAIDEEILRGRLLRRPAPGDCTYCDFKMVCGPDEAERARSKKTPDALVRLRRER